MFTGNDDYRTLVHSSKVEGYQRMVNSQLMNRFEKLFVLLSVCTNFHFQSTLLNFSDLNNWLHDDARNKWTLFLISTSILPFEHGCALCTFFQNWWKNGAYPAPFWSLHLIDQNLLSCIRQFNESNQPNLYETYWDDLRDWIEILTRFTSHMHYFSRCF